MKNLKFISKNNILDFIMHLSAYLYFVIPISIFLLGWLKIVFAIPAFFVLVAGMILSLKNDNKYIEIKIDQRKALRGLYAFCIICLWVFFSGIGGFSFQTWDHEIRNAIFHDLIDFSWPVIYDYSGQPEIHRLAGHQGGFVYYLAFWLPSALIGKFYNWKVANFFLYLWSVAGVCLFFYFTSRYLKKFSLVVLFLIIFWSGLDIIGRFLFGTVPEIGEHLEWWANFFQYSSNTTTIYWVFNQTIPAWLCLLLIVNEINTASIVFICCLAFPFAPFPFVGMLPFIIYYVSFGKNDNSIIAGNSFKESVGLFTKSIRACLTFQNIIASAMILFIFGTFYKKQAEYPAVLQRG